MPAIIVQLTFQTSQVIVRSSNRWPLLRHTPRSSLNPPRVYHIATRAKYRASSRQLRSRGSFESPQCGQRVRGPGGSALPRASAQVAFVGRPLVEAQDGSGTALSVQPREGDSERR